MTTPHFLLNRRKSVSLAAAVAAVLMATHGAPRARAATLNNGDTLNVQGTANNTGLFGQYYGLQQLPIAGAEPSLSATVTASPNFTASNFPILQNALNGFTLNGSGYSNVNFNNTAFGNGAPFTGFSGLTDNITARWSGYINIDATQAGSTTFYTTSDDGSVMYVDGVRVVNNNQFQGAVERSGAITLAAGLHEVVVAFYEGTGGAGVELRYDPAGADAKQIVPVVIPAGSTAPTGQQVLSGVQNTALAPTAGNDVINVTAGATAALNVQYALQTNFTSLTLNGGTTLNYQGSAARFGSTTFSGGGTNVLAVGTGSAFSQDVALGTLNDGGTATVLQKTGPGQLVLDQTAAANLLSSASNIEIRGGGLVVAGQSGANNPLGGASITLGSTLPSSLPAGVSILPSTMVLTGKTTTNFTLDNAITVASSNLIVAQQLTVVGNTTFAPGSAVGVSSAPTSVATGSVTLGSATNGITVSSGATATFQTNNGYTLGFAGNITGPGNVVFNAGTYTLGAQINNTGTLATATTGTSLFAYNVNGAAGGHTLGAGGTTSQITIASAVTSIGTDSFNITGNNLLSIPSVAVGGQLNRSTNFTGTTNSVIAEQVAGANAAIQNLGLNGDLIFGVAGAVTDSFTVGSIPGAAPWRGLSNDRTARTYSGGTITAMSNFLITTFNAQNLTLQQLNIPTPNGPVVASISNGASRIVLNGSTALTSNVTFTLNSGALQINSAPAFGNNANASLNARVVAYPGTNTDPGGAASITGHIFLMSGATMTVNDSNNFGGIGVFSGEPGVLVDISNATALGNSNAAQSLATLAAGTSYRFTVDNVAALAANTNNAGNFHIHGANRTETITLSAAALPRSGFVSGLLTNDNAARTLSGAVTIGAGGGTFAATTGGAFTIAAPVTVSAGGGRSLTIGTTRIVDVVTNGDIRSGGVILSSAANNWGTGGDALAQLNMVGRANLQNVVAAGVAALPQGTSLAVSLGGIYQINGGTGGGTSTVDFGALTPQGGGLFLNRNAATPDALVVRLNAPIVRNSAFGAGNRGSALFQTLTGQVLGTNDKVLFANAAHAPARINGTSGAINMIAPYLVGTTASTNPTGDTAAATTFLDVDPATAATVGFKPVTYVPMLTLGGTGDEIMDNTATTNLTGALTVAALRTNANIGGASTLNLTAGGLLFRGSAAVVTLSAPLNFGTAEGVITNLSGQANIISGALAGTNGLTKLGGNSLLLSNATSTLTGGITIDEAALRPGVNNGIPTANVVTVNAAGVLDLNNFDQSIRGLQGNGVAINNVAGTKTLTINTVNAGDSFDFTGTLRNATGTLALTKSGPGTQILSGTFNYTGATTVSGGTLLVDGYSVAASAYSIASGATLGGNGIITGAITGNAGSIFSPGSATAPGLLRVGGLTLASGATFAAQLNGPTAGTGYDQADVIGAVSFTSANLQLALNYIPSVGDKLFLVNNDQLDAISGVFASLNGVTANLNEGAVFNLTSTIDSQAYQFQINYTGEYFANNAGAVGNDVVLSVIPEPASAGLFLAGLAAVASRRRRREATFREA